MRSLATVTVYQPALRALPHRCLWPRVRSTYVSNKAHIKLLENVKLFVKFTVMLFGRHNNYDA